MGRSTVRTEARSRRGGYPTRISSGGLSGAVSRCAFCARLICGCRGVRGGDAASVTTVSSSVAPLIGRRRGRARGVSGSTGRRRASCARGSPTASTSPLLAAETARRKARRLQTRAPQPRPRRRPSLLASPTVFSGFITGSFCRCSDVTAAWFRNAGFPNDLPKPSAEAEATHSRAEHTSPFGRVSRTVHSTVAGVTGGVAAERSRGAVSRRRAQKLTGARD